MASTRAFDFLVLSNYTAQLFCDLTTQATQVECCVCLYVKLYVHVWVYVKLCCADVIFCVYDSDLLIIYFLCLIMGICVGAVCRLPSWWHSGKVKVADPGLNLAFCMGLFSRSGHTSDLVATLPGTWHYRVSTRTGWPVVSVLWLGEVSRFIYNFNLTVAAHALIYTGSSLRYTSRLHMRYAANSCL